ncbi:hypothetical protein TWF225_008363 [Orbilia oligospora]|uniref:Acyl carrier protein n=1 Tax=Orbilia oligospora TaxID=2813651 RepID=A0A4Z0XQF2_ORBOL|nr:hypothetical protein TWF103_001937 [Orbilia oligospora]KAF3110706.1 hypothetical protein TWF102_008269 [Orbilia oligospora]KAF3121864.1 hypothetical protein TWF594_003087 [Orbilia oligospora]KAF3125995.1 hypothetical protein TWF703_010642 [Orbilia oligospora]KAF3155058.1 hypothetical protein TWF751_003357 [Orbilia oligospora]
MFRTALRQSSRLLTSSMRPAVFTGVRVLPSMSVAPQMAFGGRFYSSGGPPSKADIEGRIVELLKGFDKITDPSKISTTSHFSNDLGLDSLDTVEVVMAIEEEFSVEIPDKEADAIQSVGQAVDYIAAQPGAV